MSTTTYQASRQRLGELDCVVVRPSDEAASVAAVGVFCHGFGASGEDLVGLAGELLLIASPPNPVMLVFPAAPLSLEAQGIPGGRAWWLLSIQRLLDAMEEGRYEQVREDVPEGLETARDQLVQCISECLQISRLDTSRLMLGGFSQGAMLSVETACRGLVTPPAELCLYSGALICERLWSPVIARLNETRIVQSHGNQDPILPFQIGIWLKEFLQQHGCQVDFVEFDGPHTIPLPALEKTGQRLAELASSE